MQLVFYRTKISNMYTVANIKRMIKEKHADWFWESWFKTCITLKWTAMKKSESFQQQDETDGRAALRPTLEKYISLFPRYVVFSVGVQFWYRISIFSTSIVWN